MNENNGNDDSTAQRDELPLAAASRRLRAQAYRRRRRTPRGISALLGAVLCPSSGTPLRLVANAARGASGAGGN